MSYLISIGKASEDMKREVLVKHSFHCTYIVVSDASE